ncbi:hypothetical protein LJR030_000420 [Rhizobium sp. LjRoot30]
MIFISSEFSEISEILVIHEPELCNLHFPLRQSVPPLPLQHSLNRKGIED